MPLKDMRERLGKTQAEMAELLGISRNYLALMESGKRPEQPDILEHALLIVNKACRELTADEWKDRALEAEAKLETLRRLTENMLKAFSEDT